MKRIFRTCRMLMPAVLAVSCLGIRPDEPAVSTPAGKLAALERSVPDRPERGLLLAEWETLHVHLRKARYILDTCGAADSAGRLARELDEAERCVAVIRSGNEPATLCGLKEEGYYADNDGSFQPFLRFLPPEISEGDDLPLIVYLHGYSPQLNLVNWQHVPDSLIEFAGRERFCVAAPFGRGNTDFQGIGEQDVMNVIGAMTARYPIDRKRVILAGISMGGMGVWTVAAHYPDMFAGLVVISARGDYYFWHNTVPGRLPLYKRVLVDADFGYSMLPNLAGIPAFCVHGSDDSLIPVREARHMVSGLRRVNPSVRYIELTGADHWIYEEAFELEQLREWILERRIDDARRASPAPPIVPRGPIKAAFLDPFVFVSGYNESDPEGTARFMRCVEDWHAYSQSPPRVLTGSRIDENTLGRFNVFVFGEPETSPLIRRVLRDSPIKIEQAGYRVGDRLFPRDGHGLYMVYRSPWNRDRLAVVQCGLQWGARIPSNHKYDFLPDYIVYSARTDSDGSNSALCAGFFGEDWQLDPGLMHVAPPYN